MHVRYHPLHATLCHCILQYLPHVNRSPEVIALNFNQYIISTCPLIKCNNLLLKFSREWLLKKNARAIMVNMSNWSDQCDQKQKGEMRDR